MAEKFSKRKTVGCIVAFDLGEKCEAASFVRMLHHGPGKAARCERQRLACVHINPLAGRCAEDVVLPDTPSLPALVCPNRSSLRHRARIGNLCFQGIPGIRPSGYLVRAQRA